MNDSGTGNGTRAVLRIDGLRLGQVQEVVRLLDDLEHAYNNLYVFVSLVNRVEEATQTYGRGSSRPRFKLVVKSRVSGFVLPGDKLRLSKVVFRSPGFWEFIGALNPLDVLRKWVSDRHERRKDLNYRESAEAERLYLENELLKTEVVRARIRVLEEAGVPQEKIREALSLYLAEPLGRLERHQDSGMLGGATLLRLDEENREPS